MGLISTENAEHYNWGDKCDGWHLVKSKVLSVIQERVPSGCSEVRHLHKHSEQFFYILAGIATLEVEGVINTLSNNQGMHIPANITHLIKNDGSADLIFIVVSTPPSHGDKVIK